MIEGNQQECEYLALADASARLGRQSDDLLAGEGSGKFAVCALSWTENRITTSELCFYTVF